jgi:flagellar basal body-associated protein FliL
VTIMSNHPTPDANAPQAAPRKGGLGTKLKIAGFILGVVAVEWVVAYFYLPSAAPAAAPPATQEEHHDAADSEPAKHESSEHAAASHGGHGGGHSGGHGESTKSASRGVQQEADLGEFTVTAYQPVSSSTLFISFHLYGSVLDKHTDELSKRLEEHKHQVRDNIIVIIRSAEITDLTDAGLGLIKRRILETTNRTLGKPLLQGIMFSDFSFVEQ